MLDDMQPNQIGQHENRQANNAFETGWISSEGDEHLQYNENHNVGVHNVIQPAVKYEEKCYSFSMRIKLSFL